MKLIIATISLLINLHTYGQMRVISTEEARLGFANQTLALYSESDQGGPYLKLRKLIRHSDPKNYEIVLMPRDYGSILNSISTGILPRCEEPQSSPPYILGSLPPHPCGMLKDAVSKWEADTLFACLNAKREELNNSVELRHSKVLSWLYSQNEDLQEFLGAVLTLHGEARGVPEEEIVMVLQVLENRKSYARRRGWCEANLLDVSVQPWQFSMWNRNSIAWKEAVSLADEDGKRWKRKAPTEPADLKKLVNIYLKYKQGKYSLSPSAVEDNLWHYHTRKSQPTGKWPPVWGGLNKAMPTVKINGKNYGGTNIRSKHLYVKGVPWGFTYPKEKNSAKGDGC